MENAFNIFRPKRHFPLIPRDIPQTFPARVKASTPVDLTNQPMAPQLVPRSPAPQMPAPREIYGDLSIGPPNPALPKPKKRLVNRFRPAPGSAGASSSAARELINQSFQ